MSTTALTGTALTGTSFSGAVSDRAVSNRAVSNRAVSNRAVSNRAVSNNVASTGTAAPRLRMTVRGRRVLMTISTAPLVIGAAMLMLNGGSATATSNSGSLEYISVESGQSLWQIAESIAPTEDPRNVIDEIVAINSLGSSQIVPGQQLAVPAKYTD